MASRLKQLQDRDAAIVAEMKAMSDQLKAEERTAFSEEESKKFDALTKESADVQSSLKIENQILANEKRLKVVADLNRPTGEELAQQNGEQKKESPKIVFRRNGKLKAFKGEKADEKAWRAGNWLLATCYGNELAAQRCRDHGIGDLQMLASSSGQSGSTNTAGGYLVPDELSSEIIDLRETYGVFRKNCRVVTMSSDTMIVPRRSSGLTGYFVAENNDATASTKAWDGVQLVAKKYAAMVRYSNEVAEDAIINLADDLAFEIGYTFALNEDNCGFIGDGTSTYGGMHGAAVKINDGTHSSSIYTAASGHTGFETLTLSDFHGVIGTIPQYALPNAKWYVSAYGFANSMQRLMWAGGGNTADSLSGGTGMAFLGFPVVISQVLNSTAGADVSKIKLLFGDLAMAATLGSRREITITASRDRYFEFDQVALLGTERFDVNVHDIGSTTAAGPIVALKTPGS